MGEWHRSLVRRYIFLIGVAGFVVLLDQGTKALVTGALREQPALSLLGGLVYLVYARNSGAAFSLVPSGGTLFAVAAAVACAAILALYPRVRARAWDVRIALGLILGGAAGNLLDRVRLGYVVDFIDLRWWPVFNVADSAIVIGALLLAIHSLQTREHA
jgi:signal peptidase II